MNNLVTYTWMLLSSLAISVPGFAEEIVISTGSDVVDGDVASIQALESNPGPDGGISLRESITASNNTPGEEEVLISFRIPFSDGSFNPETGIWDIALDQVSGPLVFARRNITLNGPSQAMNQGDTNPDGPEIVIEGAAGADSHGIVIHGDGIAIGHIGVRGFDGDGIVIDGGRGNTISACEIQRNGGCGIRILNGAQGNAVSDNDIFENSTGIHIQGRTTSDNTLARNLAYANPRGAIKITDGANGGIRAPCLLTIHENTLHGNAGIPDAHVEVFTFTPPVAYATPAGAGAILSADEYEPPGYLGSVRADAQGAFGFSLPEGAHVSFLAATATSRPGSTSEMGRFPPMLCVSRPGLEDDPLDRVYVTSAFDWSRESEIKVGRQPFGIGVDANGDILVANKGDNTASFIREGGETTLPVGTGPVNVIRLDDMSAILCLGDDPVNRRGEMTFIDSALTITGRSETGRYPFAAVRDPLTGNLFVANMLSDSISGLARVGSGSYEARGSYPAGIWPCDIEVVHNNLIVANYGDEAYASNNIMFIDTRDGKIRATFPMPWGPNSVKAWGRWAFVSTFLNDTVTVFDRVTRKVVERVRVGKGPGGMGLAQDGTLYIPDSLSGDVTILDCNSCGTAQAGERTGRIRVGAYPRFAAVGDQVFCRDAPGIHLMATPAEVTGEVTLTIIMIPPPGGAPVIDVTLGLFTPAMASVQLRTANGLAPDDFTKYTLRYAIPDKVRAQPGRYAFELVVREHGMTKRVWHGFSNFFLVRP